MADPAWTRRDFLRTATGAGTAAALGPAVLPAKAGEAPSPSGRPKIGAVSWCFHSFAAGTRPEEAIDALGDIGFEGIELILLGRKDIDDYWTDATIDRLRGQLDRRKLEVSQFVLFQPVVEGLSSLDSEERKRNLVHFEAGCRIAKRLGAPMVNIVAPWARELDYKGQIGYLPRFYEMRDAKPGEKFRIDIAPGFDWERVWGQWVETVRGCLERAKAHGLKFTIEHHTHCLVQDADAFLRLWDAVRDPDLGYNMDIGWTQSQREYPPVAIYKTKGKLFNCHMRDIDGGMRSFVHAGEGVMDFKGIADALKATGFRGFLNLEQDKGTGDMKATCRRYLEVMREALG
jgi:sugar phosphate isomerase/epimerase